MEKTKHTPGPWKVSEYHGAILTDRRQTDGGWCDVEVAIIPYMKGYRQGSPAPGTHATYDLNRANARLIAAAPELLNALRDALQIVEYMDTAKEDGDEEMPLIANIKALIRKATGEE